MKVRIDEDKCVGAGQCVFAADAVFDQREEDGIVILLTDSPDESQEAAVRKAARLCPAKAIFLAE
jgi:ferredoxin